jgi:hypothetical protein
VPSPTQADASPQASTSATHADVLRGAYGPFRTNNDLLYYHLGRPRRPGQEIHQRKKHHPLPHAAGRHPHPTRPRRPPQRRQNPLWLHSVEIRAGFRRRLRGFSRILSNPAISIPSISITPARRCTTGRFGAFTFAQDPSGHPWIYTACEETGASEWWPNKDQWRDEVENMEISVSIPNGLVDASNGKFMGKTDLGDGYTRWNWQVHYPINNYDVSLNIGNYVHFSDQLGDLPMDFYVLPEDLDKAKKQFVQAKGMLEAYQHYFGEYPFIKTATS